MQAVTASGQQDSYPAQIPSSSNDTSVPSGHHFDGISEQQPPKPPGPTIKQIRESMAITGPPTQELSSLRLPPAQSRKKSSFFGGIFATKEPTQLALNQVTAQMMAQHGSTTPGKVPHVSITKMPEYVPKVNTKWDGVPDAVKDRERKEKKEKDRQRALKRQSMMSSTSRPRSAASSERRGRYVLSTDSSSRDPSTSSRARSAMSQRSGPRNPHKFYAQSVNSSGDLASQQRPEDASISLNRPSQSLRSPSTTSLPNIARTVHENIPAPPAVPQMYRSSPTSILKPESNRHSRIVKKSDRPLEIAPSAEAIPEHTSSPVATPREGSPVTPSTHQAHEQFASVRASTVSSQTSVSLESAGQKVLPLPVNVRNKFTKPASGGAFLAGEARPFELPDDDDESPPVSRDLPLRQWGGLRNGFSGQQSQELSSRHVDRVSQDLSNRPDSSRSRLGLKASMVVGTDRTPWEEQQVPSALSPRSANARSRLEPATNKRLLPSLGSLRKKQS